MQYHLADCSSIANIRDLFPLKCISLRSVVRAILYIDIGDRGYKLNFIVNLSSSQVVQVLLSSTTDNPPYIAYRWNLEV